MADILNCVLKHPFLSDYRNYEGHVVACLLQNMLYSSRSAQLKHTILGTRFKSQQIL